MHGRRTREDAVEVVGIALHFRKGFRSAGGASREVRATRSRAVVRRNDLLADLRGHVIPAVRKVFDELVRDERKGRVVGLVTGIGGRRFIALPDGTNQVAETQAARSATPAGD